MPENNFECYLKIFQITGTFFDFNLVLYMWGKEKYFYLVPELQEYVDIGKMKMLPAYELSFLDEEAQRDIVDRITETEVFPSHAQARRMRATFEEGKLDYDTVTQIMNELKPNQVEKLKIPMDDIRKYVPKSMTPAEMQAYLLKLVKQDYDRHHNRDAR